MTGDYLFWSARTQRNGASTAEHKTSMTMQSQRSECLTGNSRSTNHPSASVGPHSSMTQRKLRMRVLRRSRKPASQGSTLVNVTHDLRRINAALDRAGNGRCQGRPEPVPVTHANICEITARTCIFCTSCLPRQPVNGVGHCSLPRCTSCPPRRQVPKHAMQGTLPFQTLSGLWWDPNEAGAGLPLCYRGTA